MASIVKFVLTLPRLRSSAARLITAVLMPLAGSFIVSGLALAQSQAQEIVETPVHLTRTEELSARELRAARELDWVPIEELSEQQKSLVPIACCGAYIAPTRTDADANIDPQDASFRASALESQTDQQSQVSMKGKVNITQGNRSISADGASFNKETREAELTGDIQLREPGFLFRADNARMNMDSGEGQLDNARFVLYETRIHGNAESLQKFDDNIINLDQSRITSCEPGDNVWSIEGSEITLYPDEHYGIAKHMRVNVKDVPIFYMPYARFPVGNERLSGFLFPSISPSRGPEGDVNVDLALPFYWNIAPNYDAIITPRYMSGRGSVFELETRHMSELFDSELNGSLINNDKGGYSNRGEADIKSGIPESVVYPYRGQDRWFYNFQQQGGRDQAWSSKIDYSDMSDRDYLRDMSDGAVDSNRLAFVRQMASLDYRTAHWTTGIKADEFRLLTVQQLPYRELPRVFLNGNYRINDERGEDWVIQLNNEYVDFAKNRNYDVDTANSPNAYLTTIYGERLTTDYRVIWDKSAAWGFIKPGLAVKTLSYQFKDDNLLAGTDSTPAFAVPQASIDAGLVFERTTSAFGDNFLQTFEPRAFYFYSAYKNQDALYNLSSLDSSNLINFDTSEFNFNYNQLFRTTRFVGGDRLDDANQLSLAISSAFISQTTGVERLRVSVGQIYYAQDREVSIYDRNQLLTNQYLVDANQRKVSALAFQLTSQIGQSTRLSADAAYDQRSGKLDNLSAGLHYMDDQYRLFNISYRYTQRPLITSPSQPPTVEEESLNQIDTSVLWPINSRWSVIARTNYDFHYGVELDTFAGFEYNDCCYRARIMWRRWLNFDYSPNFLKNVTDNDYEKSPYPFIEIELKGLGSMSQRISSLLDKAVSGFSEREKNLR